MKQNVSFEQNSACKSQESNLHLEKSSDTAHLKKLLAESIDANKHKQDLIAALQSQLATVQKQEQQMQSDILKADLQLQNLKLENLQKQEQEKQHEEDQNEMDMNAWLSEVQKYNGLPQSAIDSLCAMEYEGNPLDSDICLTCYKEMKTGEMAKYLPCAHLFHMNCIDEHLKISRVCPACMEEVIV